MTIKYQNTQLWCECQLVSIWNACRYWGLGYPVIGTKEYKSACVESRAIRSAANINVSKQFKKYGIAKNSGFYLFKWVYNNLPVEFSVFCHRGYHSVLAVDVDIVYDRVLLANYADGITYWLSWDRLCDISNMRCKPVQFTRRLS